jgi:hypothetical protein
MARELIERALKNLPREIKGLNTFCLWKEEVDPKNPTKIIKKPFDWTRSKKGNDNPALHLGFDQAIDKLKEHQEMGLAIYQPASGSSIFVDGKEHFLYILDLDGFVCDNQMLPLGGQIAELTGNSYMEMTPSQVGAKIFLLSTLDPQGKIVFKLTPNEFYELHPDIPKYGPSHAVEVFSGKFWNTITGDVWDHKYREIKIVSPETLQEIFALLQSHAPSGEIVNIQQPNTSNSASSDKGYSRLTHDSLIQVLSRIENQTEESWSNVANILARVYGRAGSDYFLEYSKGTYNGIPYEWYDPKACQKRFERAFSELVKHPAGYGTKHLCEMAGISTLDLIYESEQPEFNSSIFIGSADKPLAKSLKALFTPLTLDTEDVKSMEEATFIIPNLIVRGHLHAFIAEANGGKTALMVHQAAKMAEIGFEVYYVNADAGPGDLKRHFAHAKQHNYEVIAPDAKQGGSPEQVVALFKQAASDGVNMSNAVFILDTLKKFTEVIQKSDAKEFYKLLRKLTVKGATVIMLGHSNKYRGEDGKQVYEGTADLRNDVDNLIYLNSVKNELTNRLEITTQPDKIRADFQPRSFFVNLADRSIEEPDEVIQILDKERQMALRYAKEAIGNGINTKVAITKFIKEKMELGKNRLLKFLDEFSSGPTPSIYAKAGGDKNAIVYSLNPPSTQEINAKLEEAFGSWND